MGGEKVKVSMFLTAPIAQAVKIRAAKEGTGVSEVITNMFQCAYCREPITDDFLIGKPTLVAPNRYGVFFHKHRKACAAATGSQLRFFLQCPSCKAIPQQSFDPNELRKLLDSKAVEFYCISCDHRWKASVREAKEIATFVTPLDAGSPT